MFKTFTALGIASIIALSMLASPPVHAGGKRCIVNDDGVRQCLSKRQAGKRRKARNQEVGSSSNDPGRGTSDFSISADGGTAIADASGGNLSVSTDGGTAIADASGGTLSISANGGTAIADASGGDVAE